MRGKEDAEFFRLRMKYAERFGEFYGVNVGDFRPLSEHNRIMREALRTGKPVDIALEVPLGVAV